MVWHLHLIIFKEGNLSRIALISILYGLTSSHDYIEGGEPVQNNLISIFYCIERMEPVQIHLISIFYGSASSPDHIEEGEPVQNHLISIFYGSASSPDHIEGGELVLKRLISI